MRAVGLDLSLTGTGIASIGDHGWDAVETIKTPAAKIKGHQRLLQITNGVLGHCLGADLVVVEGPSFGSQGNALHQMGGLWWLIAHRLWQSGIDYRVASPSQVKKYATGKGAGIDKDRMVIEVVKRFPNVEIQNNNEADAVVLAAIGKRLLGEPVDQMPKTHLEVMTKIREEAA